jgi:glycosyltransferase involved in cell wall biosynthesis
MRIAITVDPYVPVPPRHYGGIERAVDLVVRGLATRGHDITLFAHEDSQVALQLIPYGVPPHTGLRRRSRELGQLSGKLWRTRRNFDIILSWGRLAALLPLLPLRNLPKIQRYCRDSVPWRSVRIASALAKHSLRFVGASNSVYHKHAAPAVGLGTWETIYDGVDTDRYHFVSAVPDEAPLIFVGRMEPYKGTHLAIAIAQKTGRKLLIAATMPNRKYFEDEIRPHVNHQIQYLGPVDDTRKDQLLGQSAALLMPTLCNEAFGIVMIEAMACGTPVIALSNGSVREVVRDGVNGFSCENLQDAIAAVARLSCIDRETVRKDCEKRFAATVIVDAYEQLCAQMVMASCHSSGHPHA